MGLEGANEALANLPFKMPIERLEYWCLIQEMQTRISRAFDTHLDLLPSYQLRQVVGIYLNFHWVVGP